MNRIPVLTCSASVVTASRALHGIIRSFPVVFFCLIPLIPYGHDSPY